MNELNISPEVAYNTIRYIKKQEPNPKSHEYYEVINSEGEIVKLMFGKLIEISLNYQHAYEIELLKNVKAEINIEKMRMVEKIKEVKEYYENLIDTLNDEIEYLNQIKI